MKKFFENKPRAWFLVGAIFVLLLSVVGIAVSYFMKNNVEEVDPNLLVMVGEEKIMQSDLEEKYFGIDLAGTSEDQEESLIESKGYDEDQNKYFMDLLVEESLIRQYADENGVSVTDEEAEASAKASIKDWDLLTDYQKEVTIRQHRNNLLREKTIENIVTWKKGKYIEIHFDKHFDISEALSDEEKAKLEKTREEDIQKDKEYADNLKDELYSDLKSGKITFEEAMEKVRNDKYIDYKNWDFAVSDPGVTFDTLNSPEASNLLERAGFDEALRDTKKGELADPFILKLDYGDWQNNKEELKDSIWILLTVDDEYIGKTSSINQWFSDKKEEIGVTSYVDWYNSVEKISYASNVAHAWNSTACTSGRYNEGSSHPGDLISEIRMITAAGANVAVSGSYSYVRHGKSTAYAYTGCPLLSGYTVGDYSGYGRSEASQSNGCMYRFSSVYTGTTFNLCCSGDHNPHQWKLGKSGTLEDKGYWDIRYYGISTGSAWYGPYSGEYRTSYGQRYSDPTGNGVDFTIVNGKTIYLRGYWRVNPNIAPTIERVSQSINGSSATLTGRMKDVDPGDSGKVIQRGQLRYKAFGSSTWGSWYIPDYSTSYGWIDSYVQSTGTWITKSKTYSNLANGYYEWNWNGRDVPGLYATSTPGSFQIGTPPTTGETTGCDCDLDNPDNSLGCGQFDIHDQTKCIYPDTEEDPDPDPEIACSCSPQNGLAPLVVRFDISGSNLNSSGFTFYPTTDAAGIPYTLTNGSRTIYYTYNTENAYHPYIGALVDFPDGIECCGGTVNATNPSGSDGGEVAP